MVTNTLIPLRGWGVCAPITCVTWSNAWVDAHSHSGIVGSNHVGGMKICLLWVLYVVRLMSLRRADRSSKGVLTSVVCVSVIEELHSVRLGPLELSSQDKSGGWDGICW